MTGPIRMDAIKAQALLSQCKWLLTVCIVAFALFCCAAGLLGMDGITMSVFAVYWVAGVGYAIWIGRLAHGLGRSVIYYVGGTWLLSQVIFLIAPIVAYVNIRAATKAAFTAPSTEAGHSPV